MNNLVNTRNLLSKIGNDIRSLELTSSDRDIISGSLFDVVLEHAQSIIILLENKKFSSAYALARPLFEIFIRATWIQDCATDKDIKKFYTKDKLNLNFGEMIKEIEAKKLCPKAFSMMKNNFWNIFNSFTHGGIQQINRRFKNGYIGPNFDDSDTSKLIDFVALLSFVSFIFMSEMSKSTNNDKVINELFEWIIKWCSFLQK